MTKLTDTYNFTNKISIYSHFKPILLKFIIIKKETISKIFGVHFYGCIHLEKETYKKEWCDKKKREIK